MIREIKSNVEPNKILHIIITGVEDKKERTDYLAVNEFMQAAKHNRVVGRDAQPHQHIENVRTITITQEAWVIVSGSIMIYLYDIDRTLLVEEQLSAGDCLITLYGGHGFKVLEDVILYEFKNGPYLGQEKDKVFYKE